MKDRGKRKHVSHSQQIKLYNELYYQVFRQEKDNLAVSNFCDVEVSFCPVILSTITYEPIPVKRKTNVIQSQLPLFVFLFTQIPPVIEDPTAYDEIRETLKDEGIL